MSSILKALQKLESDKETRKTREPDISTAIKMSGQRRKEHFTWLAPSVVIIVAAVSILVTFSLMGGFSAKRQPDLQTVQQPIQPQQTQSINQQLEKSYNAVEPETPALKSSTVNPVSVLPVGKKPVPTAVPILPTPQISPLVGNNKQQLPSQPQPQNLPVAKLPEAPTESSAPKPKFIISGIAWQSDSASRIAVVNGTPVLEGSSVGGVKVEQIFPDRVKFSQEGKSFEISIEREGLH
jgi:general secretion pathway protein B